MRAILLAATAALPAAGCVGLGGEARSDIRNVEWSAASIDGRAVQQPATLRLESSRRAGGNSTCNIWHGAYRLGAGTIAFSNIGSTRRACPGPLMSQENLFLRILAEADRYTLWPDGTMLIATPHGQTIGFTRSPPATR